MPPINEFHRKARNRSERNQDLKLNSRIGACLIATAVLFSPANAVAPKLKITENRRYLQYENGKPFFYLGDTAWELFHRLNREEATQYLTDRAQKGFTVIQAVALAQLGGLTVPNPYGDLPLIGGDPAKPNEAYFRHVDFIVNWYDPRYGVSYLFKEQDSWGIQTFMPPTSGRGNDWVFVLMDAAARFPLP